MPSSIVGSLAVAEPIPPVNRVLLIA